MNLCLWLAEVVLLVSLRIVRGSRLLVQIAKRLFRILDCAVDVERSNIFIVGTAENVSETCHISQALEFSLVKHLFLDFHRFEFFTPFQCS
jgi:hypothetical protein